LFFIKWDRCSTAVINICGSSKQLGWVGTELGWVGTKLGWVGTELGWVGTELGDVFSFWSRMSTAKLKRTIKIMTAHEKKC